MEKYRFLVAFFIIFYEKNLSSNDNFKTNCGDN